MKKIEAVVKPYKLEEVKNALAEIGVRGMTVTNVECFGAQGGHKEYYRDAEYAVAFVPKVKIEVCVPDTKMEKVIEAIIENAKTGEIGDGKIFVSTIDEAIRIRTGERGHKILWSDYY